MKNNKFRFIQRVNYIVCIVFLVLLTGCSGGRSVDLTMSKEAQETISNESNPNETKENKNKKIFVYVTGSVKKPGVYEVDDQARLFEVIDQAGGFTRRAQPETLNLAEPVVDGQRVHVMSKEEYKQLGEANLSPKGDDSDNGLININTASESELTTLPGVGQSKAASIISFREENGEFSTIEDIMLVPGIKDACFSNIKNLITV